MKLESEFVLCNKYNLFGRQNLKMRGQGTVELGVPSQADAVNVAAVGSMCEGCGRGGEGLAPSLGGEEAWLGWRVQGCPEGPGP